ncbi:hypothetical protein CAEBREN_06108 [Caenorhabditis brenneri]|uniref:PAN-3 domain-containing protein n=1 Tax=Caenorhabditis brenneri TaxID=135651 RepID=G0NFM1_CAEBE|nr:hypothetical protein CAEBREN_06108 [Caenorhabditis brenneri]
MIKVFGTVSNGTSISSSDVSKECAEDCLTTAGCALAYLDSEGQCKFYFYSELITVVKGKDGDTVAFKATVPDTSCPVSLDSVDFSFTTETGKRISWNQTSEYWRVGGCKDEWKLFRRKNNVIVCLEIIGSNETTRAKAQDRCENRHKAKLSGIEALEECYWVYQNFHLIGVGGDNQGVWIDGVRSCLDGVKCSNFVWTDGYTEGYDALAESNADIKSDYSTPGNENYLMIASIRYDPAFPGRFQYITAVAEDLDLNLIRGFVCGYRLN